MVARWLLRVGLLNVVARKAGLKRSYLGATLKKVPPSTKLNKKLVSEQPQKKLLVKNPKAICLPQWATRLYKVNTRCCHQTSYKRTHLRWQQKPTSLLKVCREWIQLKFLPLQNRN